MKNNCIHIKTAPNKKGILETECHKHYCICDDRYNHDNELNERYQEAKRKGKAQSGIFDKK